MKKFLVPTDINQDKSDEEILFKCIHCDKVLDYDDLLNKYGPETLYDIAGKLMKVADEDINLYYYDND